MSRPRSPHLTIATASLWLLGGCASYEPAPVDLELHRAAFARRLESGAVEAFAAGLRTGDRQPVEFAAGDGISLAEGQLLALLFHPDLRAARLRAGVAAATREEAGRWADPRLGGSFEKILTDVTNPWLLAGTLELTLPITGRLGLEQDLAAAEHDLALEAARVQEARVLCDLTEAWSRWSAAVAHAELLEQITAQLADLAAVADRLASAGEVTNVDARAFALERLTRTLELQQVRAEAFDRQAELRALMGLPPEAALEFVPQTAVTLQVADPVARRALLTDGPRVRAARRAHDASERNLRLEVRRQWPDLVLAPGFGEEDGEARALLGISLQLPLWNGNAQAIAVARAQRELAGEELRIALEQALQDLARREHRHAAASEHRRLVEADLLPLAERQIADARRMLELGDLDTLLLLDALLRAHTARVTALEAAVHEAATANDINRLYWPDRFTPATEETDR